MNRQDAEAAKKNNENGTADERRQTRKSPENIIRDGYVRMFPCDSVG